MKLSSSLVIVLLVCSMGAVSEARSRFNFGRYLLYNDLVNENCGGEKFFELCGTCAETTGDERAFTFCCKNEFGVREWCKRFLEFTPFDK